jgi:hypothetical protein
MGIQISKNKETNEETNEENLITYLEKLSYKITPIDLRKNRIKDLIFFFEKIEITFYENTFVYTLTEKELYSLFVHALQLNEQTTILNDNIKKFNSYVELQICK